MPELLSLAVQNSGSSRNSSPWLARGAVSLAVQNSGSSRNLPVE